MPCSEPHRPPSRPPSPEPAPAARAPSVDSGNPFLTDESEVFPLFQHAGVEFLYVLEGQVRYRHGKKTYHLRPGDSLFFDAEAAHGPEELVALPVKFIAVLSRARNEE